MPYIKPECRSKEIYETPGEWNYFFYKKMLHIWKDNPKYDTVHYIKKHMLWGDYIKELKTYVPKYVLQPDLELAQELAFMEFYRRIVVPYEDKKIQENGDIIV